MMFERTTIIPTTIERAFELSLDVDVHTESFSDADESAIDGVVAGVMKAGDTVTWRARHLGIWWMMTSEIVEYDPPHFFVDQQRRGPFQRFRHEHHFESASDGTTVMNDRIDFEAPLGVLGRIAERAVLGRYVPKLIDQRNAFLAAAARVERSRRDGSSSVFPPVPEDGWSEDAMMTRQGLEDLAQSFTRYGFATVLATTKDSAAVLIRRSPHTTTGVARFAVGEPEYAGIVLEGGLHLWELEWDPRAYKEWADYFSDLLRLYLEDHEVTEQAQRYGCKLEVLSPESCVEALGIETFVSARLVSERC